MKPFFTIFGRDIPIYGICFYIGIFVAAAVALLICKKKNVAWYEIAYSGVYAMIGAMLGSKLLFIAVSLKQIIEENIPLAAVIKGGFVFYGGLIGGFIGLWIYCKQYKEELAPLGEIIAVVLPLGHACGRIGCFFAGCCYGIPHDGLFSCTYSYSFGNTPIGVPLLPVQLIEAAGLLTIFIILMLIYLKTKDKTGYVVPAYLILYPILRFTLEFFRGDVERGLFLSLSTSQWVSIGVLSIISAYLVIKNIKKDHSAASNT